MKRIIFSVFLVLSVFTNDRVFSQSNGSLVDYVNPLLGTDSDVALSNGNTYPAIALPWGMNFWTPVTNKNRKSGWAYMYDDYKIYGFKQTHQPSPWVNDYGVFSLIPMTGELKIKDDERGSWFSHKAEISKPYYYRAYLADYDLVTEIAPTERAAQFRITYPKTDKSYLILDGFGGGNEIKIIPEEQKIIGYTKYATGSVPKNFRTYFVLYFDTPFEESFTWKDGSFYEDENENNGNRVQAVIKFSTKSAQKEVNVKVASSFISNEQAELNLKRELGENTFEQTKENAKQAWNKELNRIEIDGASVRQLQTFYTALYRVLLFPRKFYEHDADNNIVHYSPYNGEVLPGYMFTDNGFWDTFRAVFPFFTVMYQEINSNIMSGLVNTYKEGGWLPEWASPGYHNVMIGSNSASIIADSYLKGIRGYDIETLFEAILKNSENEGPITSVGRYGVDYYNSLGYIPYDSGINENVARTLEYSYDDFTIWQLAKALGKDSKTIDLFKKRASYYKNVFDPSTNFMRGKNKNGNWQTPFVPEKWGDAFTEGCSWHYTWAVFHDPKGLINLMGGKEQFSNRLDSLFTAPPKFDDSYYGGQIHEITEMLIANMGQYAHGNQPIQHGIYLYDYVGEPWKTQMRAREVMDKLYTPDPDGLCGDEDNGQTSAWYVFSALGMYSVCPGTTQYALGSPLFNKVTLHLENGNNFIIEAPNNNSSNVFIETATLNGENYTQNFIEHDVIMNGGKIKLNMSDKPNKLRGINEQDKPYSMTEGEFTSPPFAKTGERYFGGKTTVELACKIKGAEIRYTLDGSVPNGNSLLYSAPISINKTTTIKITAFKDGMEPSLVTSEYFEKIALREPTKVEGLVPGLKYEYYEDRVNSVEKLKNLVKTGETATVDISMIEKEDEFGVVYSGYINIPSDGMYTFYLTSDDGSKMYLDDEVFIDNDGLHGESTVQKVAAFSKGYYKFRVKYFEGSVSNTLKLEWDGSGISRSEIPADAFFMKK
ncbi:MAG: GH92 family glycosyl hydrolase [Melioribacteraceae bacterium]|nr:GH92 family glycosyl hydrolase [Melioribacteraceae bacterium]